LSIALNAERSAETRAVSRSLRAAGSASRSMVRHSWAGWVVTVRQRRRRVTALDNRFCRNSPRAIACSFWNDGSGQDEA
jgi:hypothetical protein